MAAHVLGAMLAHVGLARTTIHRPGLQLHIEAKWPILIAQCALYALWEYTRERSSSAFRLAVFTATQPAVLAVSLAVICGAHKINSTPTAALNTYLWIHFALFFLTWLHPNSTHIGLLIAGVVVSMGVHTKGKHRIGTCVLVLLVWLTPGSFAMDFSSNEGDSFGNSKSKVQLLELTESAWQVFSFAFLSFRGMRAKTMLCSELPLFDK